MSGVEGATSVSVVFEDEQALRRLAHGMLPELCRNTYADSESLGKEMYIPNMTVVQFTEKYLKDKSWEDLVTVVEVKEQDRRNEHCQWSAACG